MTPPSSAIGAVVCLAIHGPDARRFAQSQFSANVDALTPGHWQWNAWLDAKGRVRALLHLADCGGGELLAILRGGEAAAIHADLSRYLMRAQATLALRRLVATAGSPIPHGTAHTGRDGALVLGYGERSLRLTAPDEDAIDVAAQNRWNLLDIRAGWPTLPTGEPEFLPPALGLEHLAAVGFDKGCFPGQEIAARLHYRGGHKFRLCHMHCMATADDASATLRAAGCRVLAMATIADIATEALVVAPHDSPDSIGPPGTACQVVARFAA